MLSNVLQHCADKLAVLNKSNDSISFYSNPSHLGKWKKEAVIDIKDDMTPVDTIASCSQSETIWIGSKNGRIQRINKNNHAAEQTLQLNHGAVKQISCTADNKYTLIEIDDDKKILLVYDNLKKKIIN